MCNGLVKSKHRRLVWSTPAHSQGYIEYTQNNNTHSLPLCVIKVTSCLFPSGCRWSCLFCLPGFTFCGSLCVSLITPLRLRWTVSYDRSQQTDLLQFIIMLPSSMISVTTTRLSWTLSLVLACLQSIERGERKPRTIRQQRQKAHGQVSVRWSTHACFGCSWLKTFSLSS